MNAYAIIIRAVTGDVLTERTVAAVSTDARATVSYDSATSILRLTASVDGGEVAADTALKEAISTLRRSILRYAGAAIELREWRVLAWEDFEVETFRPAQRGDLAGAAEASEILGVSRQRIAELRKDHKDFPTPVENLKSGPVWDRAELEGWERTWERRRTGRPKSV
jgi:hypothetical protein